MIKQAQLKTFISSFALHFNGVSMKVIDPSLVIHRNSKKEISPKIVFSPDVIIRTVNFDHFHSMLPNFTISIISITFVIVVVTRIFYVIYQSGKHVRNAPPRTVSTLIVLGSGGHTAEMLNLITVLRKDRFAPRVYVAAKTDNMSLQKARVLEDSLVHQIGAEKVNTAVQFMHIYRSREVGQSYLTSVMTTLIAIVHALWLMIKIRPQVILCNGPGTCFPLCLIAFLFKVVGIRWSSIFYVESIARVKRLSLSGLLLYKLHIADLFFVQWPQLQKKYPRAHYLGGLM